MNIVYSDAEFVIKVYIKIRMDSGIFGFFLSFRMILKENQLQPIIFSKNHIHRKNSNLINAYANIDPSEDENIFPLRVYLKELLITLFNVCVIDVVEDIPRKSL